jgi:hypothetical protein
MVHVALPASRYRFHQDFVIVRWIELERLPFQLGDIDALVAVAIRSAIGLGASVAVRSGVQNPRFCSDPHSVVLIVL